MAGKRNILPGLTPETRCRPGVAQAFQPVQAQAKPL